MEDKEKTLDENIESKDDIVGEDNQSENNVESDEYEEVETIIDDKEIDETDPTKLRQREIAIRLQELEILMDDIEFQLASPNENEELMQKYNEYKKETKDLYKEKKQLKKEEKKSLGDNDLEQASIWIFIYGIIVNIINFPAISYNIWFAATSWFIEKTNLDMNLDGGFWSKVIVWLALFALPILLLFVSWILFATLVKKKINKKIFLIFWIIQILFTVGMIIYLTINTF